MSLDIDDEIKMDDTINDTAELEKYGVWVKNAPKDLGGTDFLEDDNTSLSLDELNNIALDVQPTESDSLEEINFDDINTTEETQVTDNITEEISFDDINTTEEIDLADFGITDDQPSETTENVTDSLADGEVDLGAFMDTESVNLDDFVTTEKASEKKEEIIDEQPIEMDLTFDDSFVSDTKADPVNDMENIEHNEIEAESFIPETQELDDFDALFDNIEDEKPVDNKEIAQELASDIKFDDASEFDDLLSSLDSDAPATQESKSQEIKKTVTDYDISVDIDDDNVEEKNIEKNEDSKDDSDIDDISLFESSDASEYKKELENPQQTSYTSKDFISSDSGLDELDKIIDDTEVIPLENVEISEENNTQQENSMDEMSKALLNKIIGEISSLKDEFASLKSEFNSLKTLEPKNEESFIDNESLPEENIEEEKQPSTSGFFSDDVEDETIALSGDELNNILVNAEFTEDNSEEEQDFLENVEDDNSETIDSSFDDEPQIEVPEDEIIDEHETSVSEDDIDDVTFDFENTANEESPIVEESSETTQSIELPIGGTDDILANIEDFDQEEFAPEDQSSFNDDNLVEPTLDDLDFGLETEEEATTEESTVDSIIVEPSTTDFIDTEPVTQEPLVEEDIKTFDDGIAQELPEDADSYYDSTPIDLNDDTMDSSADTVDNLTMQPETITDEALNSNLKQEVKQVLSYMDQLLEDLPEEKIAEFAKSEHFETYKKLFRELGLS